MRTPSFVWTLCLLLLIPAVAIAQTPGATGTISGTVVAEDNGSPLAGATVAVRRPAAPAIVGGRITDQQGRFTISGLAPGTYSLEIRAVGRAVVNRADVTVGTAALDLGTIRMAATAVQVQGVTATGQRSAVVVASDRSIYSVRDMPISQGSMATDALRTIPEIEVDFEDQIRARGGSPAIYVDGRPAQMQGEALTNFIRSLRADRLDRIEYIPNPSANFDSEGQSGIVNIVLRRDANLGLSGTLSGNAGSQGTQGSALRLNYQNGRFTMFGGGSVNFSDGTTETYDLRQNLAATDTRAFVEQSSFAERDGRSGSTDAQAEFRVTPRSTVWATGRANWGVTDRTALNGFAVWDAARVPTERSEQELDGYNTNRSWGGSLGFRRVVQPLRDEFSTELRYGVNWTHSETDFDRYLLALTSDDRVGAPNLIYNDGFHDDDVLSYQADLSKPIGTLSKIDVGYRLNLRDNQDRQHLLEQPRPDSSRLQQDVFNHLEDFHAAYVTLERKFGALVAQAGVRVERADTRVNIPTSSSEFENDENQVYPSLNLAYDFGSGRNARLSYSKRVQRPNSGVMNPINLSPGDPYNRSFGNPRLDPMYVHSVSLDASWAGQLGTLRASPYFFWMYDLWDRVRTVGEDGVSTLQFENAGEVKYGGASLSATLRQWGPISGTVGFNLLRGHLEGTRANVNSFTATAWQTNGNATIRLSPTLSAQLMASYSPWAPLAQGRQESTVYSTMAIRQQLFANKVSVNLAVLDPLDVYRVRFVTSDSAHEQNGRTNPSQRRATLTVSYNFGRTPTSNRRTVTDEAAGAPIGGGGDIR